VNSTHRDAVRGALRANADDLLAYFERRTVSREDASDLLGETMIQAWRRVEACPAEPVQQRMWLYGIAANTLLNHRRSTARRLALCDRLRQHLAAAPGGLAHDDQTAIRDAVERLNPTQRELVHLVHWDGLSLVEAASILGINASTARSRYAAARSALKEALSEPARS